jgi:tetratricopeptide (TPR) repeat protein
MARGEADAVLTPEMARLMLTPQINMDKMNDMALGFFLERRGQSVYFEHGGADVGFVCQLVANKEAGYGAAVMTNADNRPDRLINEILQSIAVEYKWKDFVAPVVVPLALGREELADFAGRYRLSSDDVLSVRLVNDKLEGKTSDSPPFELVPASKSEFVRRDSATRYIFERVETGSPTAVKTSDPRGEERAERLPADVMTPLELLLAGDAEAAVKAYKDIQAKDPKDPAVNENRLNNLGYRFLSDKKYREAIVVFKLNVELYPRSWNVYDSLAEAYMNNGEKDLAILNYEKSLTLNPDNVNGAQMLKKLKEQ